MKRGKWTNAFGDNDQNDGHKGMYSDVSLVTGGHLMGLGYELTLLKWNQDYTENQSFGTATSLYLSRLQLAMSHLYCRPDDSFNAM